MKKILLLFLLAATFLQGWADDNYYLLGDATPIGWIGTNEEARTPTKMVETGTGTGIFTWTGLLKVADNGLKICKNNTWTGFRASSNQEVLVYEADISTQDENDNKWKVTESNYCKVTLNTSTSKIRVDRLVPAKSDGTCLIETESHLTEFRKLVNDKGMTSLNAELKANINLIGSHTPIGTSSNKYSGTFDGKGYVIANMSISSDQTGVGFFGYTNGATIKDLEILKANVTITGESAQNTGIIVGICDNTTIQRCAIVNSYLTGRDHTGSIAGSAKGGSSINDCFSNAYIKSKYQVGGIVGTANGNVTLSHCIFMGPCIEATDEKGTAAGLISRLESGTTTLQNNFVAAQHIFSGGSDYNKYCKALLSDKNDHDYLSTYTGNSPNYSLNSTVYGKEEDQHTYTLNKPNDRNGNQIAPSSVNESFFSSTLGFDFTDKWEMVSGKTYLGGSYPILKGMSIPDNIAISSPEELIDFSTFMWDNTNATLQNDIDLTDKEFKPLGRKFETIIKYYGTFDGNNHSIKNLTIDSDKSYIGLFGYLKGGADIKNLIIDSTCSFKGTTKVGGIAGMADGGGTIKLSNVINAATIEATGSSDANAAGFIACCINSTKVLASNCINRGNVSNAKCNECAAFTGWSQSGSTYSNCANTGTISNMASLNEEAGTKKNLYRGDATLTYCFDASKTPNRGQGILLDVSDDDIVTISNPTDLCNFSSIVNLGATYLNATLENDIDMSSESYTPIGTSTYKYKGTFDGQNHFVKLNINTPEISRVGFIAYAYATAEKGAHIKNLLIKGDIKGDSYVAGIIGSLSGTGGNITFENCGNEANITASNVNAGGIFGCSFDGGVKARMINCYNSGDISGSESGQLTGWSTNTEITNCYAIGECKVDCHPFARLSGTNSITNCYSDYNITWDGHPTYVTAEQIASGELCYLLNSSTCYEPNWFQTIETDGHPVLSNTHGIVNKMSAAGYTTQYIPGTDVTIPDGVEAYTGVILSEGWLHLNAIENGKIAAGEAVILKGNEGYYSFMPTTDAEKVDDNVLIGSDGTITGGDGIYALAKKGNPAVVGFYSVNSDVPVPAGKVYLDSDGSLVKVFKFVFDDDDETGLNSPLLTSPEEEGQVYNLAGQRISKLQRGINIINGKKVLK